MISIKEQIQNFSQEGFYFESFEGFPLFERYLEQRKQAIEKLLRGSKAIIQATSLEGASAVQISVTPPSVDEIVLKKDQYVEARAEFIYTMALLRECENEEKFQKIALEVMALTLSKSTLIATPDELEEVIRILFTLRNDMDEKAKGFLEVFSIRFSLEIVLESLSSNRRFSFSFFCPASDSLELNGPSEEQKTQREVKLALKGVRESLDKLKDEGGAIWNKDPNKLLGVKEVCEVLGISESTLYKMKAGPMKKVGGKLAVKISDLQQWIDKQGEGDGFAEGSY